MKPGCPDDEALFTQASDVEVKAHVEGCEACRAVLEMHRQLEKDLFRLQDPLPPPDFVKGVMAKVQASRPQRVEVRQGAAILAGSVLVALSSFLFAGGSPAEVGVSFARMLVGLRGLLVHAGSLTESLWNQSPVVLSAALALFAAYSLYQNRRAALRGAEAHSR